MQTILLSIMASVITTKIISTYYFKVIIRKDAVAATGILTVNGVKGTRINEGDLFATLASGEEDISIWC